MRKETVICDECGNEIKNSAKPLRGMVGDSSGTLFLIRKTGGDNSWMDFCGAACVIRKVSEFLQNPPEEGGK